MTHKLLNGVAATTAHRDRDDLDRAVGLLLLRFLETRSVTVLRLAGDHITKRVARRLRVAEQRREIGTAAVENTTELPFLNAFPAWKECAATGRVVRCTSNTGESQTTVFPIQGATELVGLLVVETTKQLTAREADLVVGILDIIKNHLALLDYGELDTLTGLLNRKTFESHFHKRCQRLAPELPAHSSTERRSVDTREPSWLAIVDIDHFKSINDGFGHLFGDEVLLLASRLMRRSLRGADQLFRFGGEEFVVVLDHESDSGAEIVFERLRATVEQHLFPQVGRVTISIGYTRIKPNDISTTCVERADAALYYAKNHGRNNVRSWEVLEAAGEVVVHSGSSDVELF